MSNIVKILDLQKVENRLQVVNPNQCLNYIGKQCVSSEQVVFTIRTPFPTLRYWYTCKSRRWFTKPNQLKLDRDTQLLSEPDKWI